MIEYCRHSIEYRVRRYKKNRIRQCFMQNSCPRGFLLPRIICTFAVVNKKKYIYDLIAQGEHQQQDFKYKIADAHKLAKSVSAFANTDGGRLLIGVRDDGHLSGVRSEEEIYMMHAAAYQHCQPAASIKFDTYYIDGRTLVIATIPPSDKKPICAVDTDGKKRAYIRINDENIVASPVHLAIWREQMSSRGTFMTYSENETMLMDAMKTKQGMTLNQIVRKSRLARHKVITTLARLIRFDIVGWTFDNHQFTFSLK